MFNGAVKNPFKEVQDTAEIKEEEVFIGRRAVILKDKRLNVKDAAFAPNFRSHIAAYFVRIVVKIDCSADTDDFAVCNPVDCFLIYGCYSNGIRLFINGNFGDFRRVNTGGSCPFRTQFKAGFSFEAGNLFRIFYVMAGSEERALFHACPQIFDCVRRHAKDFPVCVNR